MDICNKCGASDWGAWTSTTTLKAHRYCRNCRRQRARDYTSRKEKNGGKHTNKEWQILLLQSNRCAICKQRWDDIPRRPDKRYKNVWTKDHIIPLSLGGTYDITNIQAVCYRCNSAKCNRMAKQQDLSH
jgi:5-methylcytosine-specific restriction endonuclease McrA